MDRNTIIGFVIIGVILLMWPLYQKKVVGINPPRKVAEERAVETQTDRPGTDERQDQQISQPVLQSKRQPVLSSDLLEATPDTVFLENDLFSATLSSLGGGTLISWKLKTYEKIQKDNLTGADEAIPVDLIPSFGRDNNLAFRMVLADGSEYDLSKNVFKVTENEQGSVQFEKTIPGKGRVVKTIHSNPEQYDVDLDIRFYPEAGTGGRTAFQILWNTGLASTEKFSKEEDTYHQAFALQGGELLKEKKDDSGVKEGSTQWMALRNKYFIMAMIPSETPATAVRLQTLKDQVSINDYSGNKVNWKEFTCTLFMDTPSGENGVNLKLFLGPLEYKILKSYDVELEKAMDMGWAIIRFFSIPLYHALDFLGRTIGNYGLAIIILSILIKVVLYPLTRKSYKSMREMQALQPKITALRDKYAKDPQRLNQETMKLYKEHGVNPMGGCLPMVLQMPVLFALFRLFRSTIMFRQATFGPIQDLSSPDALLSFGDMSVHVLPILMGATMFVQQKLTVQDPKQKMMAYFMPIFLTFIFYKMSAGLNLYYLMFNLLTIAQEVLIKRPKKEAVEA